MPSILKTLTTSLAGLGILPGGATKSVGSTVLILARDDADVASTSPGLDAYGIPWQKALIAQGGSPLPVLNSTATNANFGSIILIGSLSYDYNGVFKSALTDAQWNQIYAYQSAFNVRMVRINEYPGIGFGATPYNPDSPGCCDASVSAGISLPSTALIPGAGLKANAPVLLNGLYHYPAKITATNGTTAFAMFEPAGPINEKTVAAVINNNNGREQLVWFTSIATEWSLASSFLSHAYIHWMTRSLFVGKRKLHLSTQVDDLQLSTDLYYPNGTQFKLRTGDLDAHVTWQKNINARMPTGSSYWMEFGHNGNGNIESATNLASSQGKCFPADAVEYPEQIDPPLEFQKPLGTGTDIWPPSYNTYNWSTTCSKLDEFGNWFRNTNNLNAFAHISHTFSHEELNNATYHDAAREIQFNQAWMKQMGIDKATRYTADGIIPPAITGLHNGDVIKAWMDNKIKYVVGDNTRPLLRNPQSKYWPLLSNKQANGYDGLWIVPRFSTTIYFNCEQTDCLLREWKVLTGHDGTFQDLLLDAKLTNVQYLMNLQADPYMFHQANLRQTDMPSITVGSQTGKFSLIQSWVETVVQELTRLTSWPIVSLTHDQFAQYFINRMTLDNCKPTASYTYSSDGKSIQSVTVTTTGNKCSAPVPVTIPKGTAYAGLLDQTKVDQVGSEPPIVWVTMRGTPVTLRLTSAVSLA